jgi:hypothetical protein
LIVVLVFMVFFLGALLFALSVALRPARDRQPGRPVGVVFSPSDTWGVGRRK